MLAQWAISSVSHPRSSSSRDTDPGPIGSPDLLAGTIGRQNLIHDESSSNR
jgi:hypothetical protein